MRAETAVKAYAAIMTVVDTEMDPRDAKALLALKEVLRIKTAEFTEREKVLVDKYANKDENGNVILDKRGQFRIDGEEKVKEYLAEREALAGEDIGKEMPRLMLHLPKVRPSVMEALADFIDFI